jgi:ferredoxin
VRGERPLQRIDGWLAWLDGWVARWLPPEFNLLAQAGAGANVALLIAVVSGVAMLLWYSPSLQFAYPSLAAIQGRTLGGWVRALHRYSSDLTMLLLCVHAARVFIAQKFAGARWLAWVSGVIMLALIWFIGWTGYWLVWDQPAQQVAVSSMRLLDALPVFGEPLGRLYVADRMVPSLLFFVIFFLHMLLPLAIAIGLALHLTRLSRAHLLPRRELAWAITGALALASVLVPAPLDARAEMAVKAETFTVDAWYLSPLALGLRFQSAGLWVTLLGGVALGTLVPWLLGRRRAPSAFQAVVAPERCHSCSQCAQDCPFDAIKLVARTDGKRFPAQAWVDPARCTGCGVCGGSCDSGGIGLTWFDTRIEEARLERAIGETASATGRTAVALVAGEIQAPLPELPGYQVHRVPTASWIRPTLIERVFASGIRSVLVVRDARTEAAARDGGRWIEARLAGLRKPAFRSQRGEGDNWLVVDFDPARPAELVRLAEGLRCGHATRDPRPHRLTIAAVGSTLALLATLGSIAPSHLSVANPASPTPELVLSFKAFGRLMPTAEVDAAAEASKPVHMRGRSTAKPHRAPVIVRITIDGVTAEREFSAKGVSHDGPAMGEWRQSWPEGEHQVGIEILAGGEPPSARWEGRLRAAPRRLQVISYDSAAGFTVE